MKILRKIFAVDSLIIIVATFLLFWNIGENALTNWDEAWYADVSRTMATTGNYVTPIWNGEVFFEKPPLYFWASSIAYGVFANEEFAARFFSVLSGVGVIWLVYRLALLLWGRAHGVVGAIVAMSTIGFLFRTRTGNIDTFFAFWILATIYCFYKAYVGKNSKWFIIMGICIAAAFLSKGILAFLFPALAALLLFIDRKTNELPSYLLGLTTAVAIVVVWVAIDYASNGGAYVYGVFFHQTDKIGSNFQVLSHFSTDYVFHLKSGMKWWFVLFIPSFLYSFWTLRKKADILLPLFFFSIRCWNLVC